VQLSNLSVRHFRNLVDQDLDVPDEGFALVGENAQGKSNLLEAVYYLETFRSFRGARDDQLVTFGEDVFRVAARVSPSSGDRARGQGEAHAARGLEVTAAFQRRGRRKKVTVDGAEPGRLSEALGRLGVVIFSPADVAVINEGPAERRRFLDVMLSLNLEGYLQALQEYRRVLSQRNAALREDQPADMVALWNEPLVRSGAKVMAVRARWVSEHTTTFTAFYEVVSGGQSAGLDYRCSVKMDDMAEVVACGDAAEERLAEAFRGGLRDARGRERRVGTTVLGPHRDDMSVSLEGERALDVRDFGSGGQRRTAALALRLVEARTIRDRRGLEPLVLLDDVFAELDAGRSERILSLLEGEQVGQVILTAPKESDVRLRRDSLPRWRVVDGRIEA
jgi:DNA replication and repair protein RecF